MINRTLSPDDEETGIAECATDYWSPCCEGHGIYAHFTVFANGSETLSGFQCTECGGNYDISEKENFDEH